MLSKLKLQKQLEASMTFPHRVGSIDRRIIVFDTPWAVWVLEHSMRQSGLT